MLVMSLRTVFDAVEFIVFTLFNVSNTKINYGRPELPLCFGGGDDLVFLTCRV